MPIDSARAPRLSTCVYSPQQPSESPNKMHFLSATRAFLVAAVAASTASAHNIVLPAHGLECFHESLHKDDKMSVTYQVGDREFGSAGNLDIDFWVRPSPI